MGELWITRGEKL